MRSITRPGAVLAALILIGAGCGPSNKTISPAGQSPGQSAQDRPTYTPQPARTGQKVTGRAFTPETNPTANAGRGTPSLDDFFRLPAWVFVDGKAGTYIERDGQPLVSWVIQTPVSATPTFRVEAYQPLLGTPRDFSALLYPVGEDDEGKTSYSIRAHEGRFEVGRQYSLLRPGADFVIRNLSTGDVVAEIAELMPGMYEITAGVKNLTTGQEGLTVTRFTVGDHN